MKTRGIIIVGAFLTALGATGQEWIGNRFTLDTIVDVMGAHTPANTEAFQCFMQDNSFYFVERQGYQDRGNGYCAIVHAVSMDDYSQTEITLPLPECGRNKERYARSLWIYDLCLHGDSLLVTTQDELILYKRINNQNYRVENRLRHRNLFMGYIHQNSIHFFEEDHDKGFKWFQQGLSSDSATLIRELPYEAPHIVQIQPNRYISHNQQSVFFLSTRYPRLQVFSLDGKAVDTIHIDLPFWKPFDDEYIRKTMTVPYGIERIHAVKDDLYAYSYPKVALPLGGGILLLYTQFDTLTGKSALQYAVRNKNGKVLPYSRNNLEDSAYTAARFPFSLFHGGFDKGNATDGQRIVQLTYNIPVSWHGRLHKTYIEDVNRYFAENEPKLAYLIMRYVPQQDFGERQLQTRNNGLTTIDDLQGERSILILHQGLECSGCMKALYQLMNQSGLDSSTHIGHVFPQPANGMQSYELWSQIRQQLRHPFSIYSETSHYYKHLTAPAKLHESDFPCVILYQKSNKPKVFRVTELFTENSATTEFNDKFLQEWQLFLQK